MKGLRWLVIVALLGALAVSCSRSDNKETSSTTSVSSSPSCQRDELRETDIGVTADTVTIEVMADIGNPLAPGLFQGNVDAVKGYARYLNDHGGLACRRVAIRVWDSKLNADEAKNGQIDACHFALALVGSNSLFNPDASTMASCPDQRGAPTGIADVAAIADDIHQICNPTTFIVTGINEKCPVPADGPLDFTFDAGAPRYFAEHDRGLHGVYLLPGDLPTLVQSGLVIARAMEVGGLTFDAKPKVSGRNEQAAFTPLIQMMRSHKSNFVLNGSSDSVMIKFRKETAAQAYDGVKLWLCILSCYTEAFRVAGDVVDGTYVWLAFVPFEEKAYNKELATFIDYVGESKVDSWGAEAWQAAALFKRAVDDIVSRDGPNALTRASLLQSLTAVDAFSDNGWVGTINPKRPNQCFVIVQLRHGVFNRVYPEKKGTLDCNAKNLASFSFDAPEAAANLP